MSPALNFLAMSRGAKKRRLSEGRLAVPPSMSG
jgi:hypothetical protein